MMNKPLISVIIPIYNTEKYLPRCIESLISQEYNNLDIILIDDGSTDDSKNICQKYREMDHRIRLFMQNNSGVSVARNLGLDNALGEYIIFIDSDDYVGKDHILLLYKNLMENRADMCITRYKKFSLETLENISVNTSYKKSILNNKDAIISMLLQKDFGWECVAKLYSRKSISNIRFDTNENIGEDFTFCYRVLHNSNKVIFISTDDYYYYIRPNSATQSPYHPKYDRLLHTAKNFELFIQKNYSYCIWISNLFYAHSCIEILDRLLKTNPRDRIKEDILMKILREKSLKILLNKRVSIKFKMKILIILINKKLFLAVKDFINK